VEKWREGERGRISERGRGKVREEKGGGGRGRKGGGGDEKQTSIRGNMKGEKPCVPPTEWMGEQDGFGQW
jgi:hypothetical protein